MSTATLKTATQKPGTPPAPPHPLREFWNYFSANNGAVIGLVIVIGVLLLALFAPLLAPHAPNITNNA
ncbi:MAG: dipeptide ABC transporter permease DppC, partial [Polaromonas sp.]